MTTASTSTSNEPQTRNSSPTLVVGLDFSPGSIFALDQALQLAMNWKRARLIAVTADASSHVSNDGGLGIEALASRVLERLSHVVAERAELSRTRMGSESVDVRLRVTDAAPTDALRRIAYLEGADLILVGATNSSRLGSAVLGSVPLDLSREAPCSVMVCQIKADLNEPQIEPPPPEGQQSTLPRRHTYHYESRVGQSGVNMPLLFPLQGR